MAFAWRNQNKINRNCGVASYEAMRARQHGSQVPRSYSRSTFLPLPVIDATRDSQYCFGSWEELALMVSRMQRRVPGTDEED
jgi:hypothetical protein